MTVVARRRRLLLPASVLLATPPPGRPASAHALVTASEPASGAVLAAGPECVWLRFNSRVDRARSRLLLHGPDNGQTPLPLDPAATGDEALLSARTDIVPWAAGAWRLRWQVLALDGHITRGDVAFTVRSR